MLAEKWVETDQKTRLVDNPTDLVKAAEHISLFREIAVDLEMYAKTYITLVSLIQITTREYNYVIDCLKLFRYIKLCLGPIFEDRSILKIIHSCNDFLPLQSNFEIYTVGAIDTQEIYWDFAETKNLISLKDMVKDLLGKEISKEAQTADFSQRPLPKELLHYAAKDSQYLFDCWIILKEELEERRKKNFIKHHSCKKVKAGLLQLYRPLSPNEKVKRAWQSYKSKCKNYWNGLKDDYYTIKEKYLDGSPNHKLFEKIFLFREKLGKQKDSHVSLLLSDQSIQRILREVPLTLSGLKACMDEESESEALSAMEMCKIIVIIYKIYLPKKLKYFCSSTPDHLAFSVWLVSFFCFSIYCKMYCS